MDSTAQQPNPTGHPAVPLAPAAAPSSVPLAPAAVPVAPTMAPPAPRPAPAATAAPPMAASLAPVGGFERPGTEERAGVDDLDLTAILARAVQIGASDVHLTIGTPPLLRIDGDLQAVPDAAPLAPDVLRRTLYAILTQRQRERFEAELELDFAYAVPGQARFRVNIYRQREALGAAFRRIPYEIRSVEELRLPPVVNNFASPAPRPGPGHRPHRARASRPRWRRSSTWPTAPAATTS